jgi:hypothetical protein
MRKLAPCVARSTGGGDVDVNTRLWRSQIAQRNFAKRIEGRILPPRRVPTIFALIALVSVFAAIALRALRVVGICVGSIAIAGPLFALVLATIIIAAVGASTGVAVHGRRAE